MCMGTTASFTPPRKNKPVHPHVHGDNSRSIRAHGSVTGSPPCAWGQRSPTRRASSCRAVHPHVHGDNESSSACRSCPIGSPPCAWGQLGRRAAWQSRPAVHPHVHGDNAHNATHCQNLFGSPPCAWGQRRPRHAMATTAAVHPHVHGDNDYPPPDTWGSLRFTPMCMGTTLGASDHVAAVGGSPPCAWGQHDRRPAGHAPGRFTPMCMGTTSTSCVGVRYGD